MPPKKILLTTFGSLGDLHPYLALALELKRRGHRPVVGSVEPHRPHVEAAGIEFETIRTAVLDRPEREVIQRVFDERRGPEFLYRDLIMPSLRLALADTLAAAKGAALLVAHPLTFATRLVAETTGTPWLSTQLAPLAFLSPHDPPVIPGAPFLDWLRPAGPQLFRPLWSFARRTSASWVKPYHQLRAELGLPGTPDAIFANSYSPLGVLALFSSLLGQPQPDWPPHTTVTGFAFYDGAETQQLPTALERFLEAGEPPIVFTLGSSAVMDAGAFYQHSAEAAGLLGRRAVLLTGSDLKNRPANLPQGVLCVDYAPFSLVFPRAAALVHQGGVGTTAQAMRAGKPMLVMPYAMDQPDNAARVARLGIARVLSRTRYSPGRAAAALDALLSSAVSRAQAVGRQISAEQGAAKASDRIERLL